MSSITIFRIPTAIPTKEAKAEMKTHPVTVYNLEPYKPVCAFYLLIHFGLFFR